MCYDSDVIRSEEERASYNDVYEESTAQCPECGSRSWDYLVKNVCGDVVGCEECVTKMYLEDLSETYLGEI